ncbi:MAG: hypothetical protein C0524_18045 [Rhodobacter sp.]|nr:hypothetical protein [Rhodobacter sp.]
MMHLKPLTAILAVSLLTLSPALPVFDLHDGGAAYAKGGNGGGNGGGKSESQSDKKSGKSAKSAAATKKPMKAASEVKLAKGKHVVEGQMHPSELGKMNGAMNANINAVLAHIRNGQTTNGPVGLLAGLAVADAGAAAALTAAAEMEELVASFDELDTKLADAGFASPEEYLQAKADGTLTDDQLLAAEELDALIDDVGGTTEDGLALAETKPTEEEIAAAEDAAAAAEQDVTDAEQAIGDAWNKDGDLEALLTQLREKLAPYEEEIGAAVAETIPEEETAEVLPEEVVLLEEEPVVE